MAAILKLFTTFNATHETIKKRNSQIQPNLLWFSIYLLFRIANKT